MIHKTTALAILVTPIAGMGIHQAAVAQGAEKPVFEEVIVTATRTEAPAGQTGVSATAFNADAIARRQAQSLPPSTLHIPEPRAEMKRNTKQYSAAGSPWF